MSMISGFGGAAAGASSEPTAATDRGEDRARFGLALWLALTAPLSDALFGLGGASAPGGGSGRSSADGFASRSAPGDSFSSRDRSGIGAGPPRSPDPPGSDGGARERGDPGRSADRVERSERAGTPGSSSEPGSPPPSATTAAGRDGRSGAAAAAAVSGRTGTASAEPAGRITVVGSVRGIGARTGAPAKAVGAAPGEAGEAAVARAQKLAGKAGRSSGFVLVPFQDEAGAEGRVRLSVRGSALNATILSSDRDTVERLGRRLGDLHRALAARGFTAAQLSVRESRTPASAPGRPAPQDDPGRSGRNHPERDPHQQGDHRSSEDSVRFTFDTRQVHRD